MTKLYEAKEPKEQACAEYENPVEDWKDADADIPEPVDAEKRLAAL